ncbi:MAG TPA: hypothetical protein VNB06_16910 [Thermoanaerobaculia bacterium]|nr:hypothetical protein [Thermoanaerobaculia bacterium]
MASSFADLEALGLDRDSWTDARLTGLVDFPALALLFAKEDVLRNTQDPRLEKPLEQLAEIAAYADRSLAKGAAAEAEERIQRGTRSRYSSFLRSPAAFVEPAGDGSSRMRRRVSEPKA